MPNDDEEVRITLRLPARLRDDLAEAASTNSRSMNGEIVARLEAGIKGGSTRHEVLYVLLDADGHPTSWDEILTHLSKISSKANFDPAVVQGHIVNADIKDDDSRDHNWMQLVKKYRQLKGLPAEPSDGEQS